MATWEDGPEYAPLERPDAFRGPDVAISGLEPPPPAPEPSAAPVERPAFTDPSQAVPPLAALVPAPPDQRDPSTPFEVAASVMTAESSAWAAVHWAPPQAPPVPSQPDSFPTGPFPAGPVQAGPFPAGPGQAGPSQAGPFPAASSTFRQPYGRPRQPNGQRLPGPGSSATTPSQPTAGPQSFPAPTGVPVYPPPTGSPVYPGPTDPDPSAGPFPAPGTPQWFVPSPYQPPPAPGPPTAPTARAVLAAATPGVVITLGVGGLIWVLAPVTVVVAFLLSGRMTYGRKPTRTAFSAVLAFLGLVGLLAMVAADGVFSQWWGTVAGWACFGSWVLLLSAVTATYLALKQGRPDPPPTRRGRLR